MIEVDLDDRELGKALGRLDNRVKNTSPLMRQLAGAMKTQSDMNIRLGVSAEEEPFADLAESTKAARTKKRKWPGRILQVMNNLNRSVTPDSGSSYAMIGSNLPYARRHQIGDIKPPKKGPQLVARPYMPITGVGELQPKTEKRLLELTLKHLES